jgi:hypothetical protein
MYIVTKKYKLMKGVLQSSMRINFGLRKTLLYAGANSVPVIIRISASFYGWGNVHILQDIRMVISIAP